MEDALGRASKEDIFSFLIGFPKSRYDPAIGGYYLAADSNLNDGAPYLALSQNPVVLMEGFRQLTVVLQRSAEISN